MGEYKWPVEPIWLLLQFMEIGFVETEDIFFQILKSNNMFACLNFGQSSVANEWF